MERGTTVLSVLRQHNDPARTWLWTNQSGVQHANHKTGSLMVEGRTFKYTWVIWHTSYLTVQSWLLSDPHMKPRSMYPPFVQAGDQYLKALLPIVSPLQVIYKYFDHLNDKTGRQCSLNKFKKLFSRNIFQNKNYLQVLREVLNHSKSLPTPK